MFSIRKCSFSLVQYLVRISYDTLTIFVNVSQKKTSKCVSDTRQGERHLSQLCLITNTFNIGKNILNDLKKKSFMLGTGLSYHQLAPSFCVPWSVCAQSSKGRALARQSSPLLKKREEIPWKINETINKCSVYIPIIYTNWHVWSSLRNHNHYIN